MSTHRESPYKRTYPSGKTMWVARYTRPDGTRDTAGTFDLKRDAQTAIDQAHEDWARGAPETLGAYAATWTDRRPRSKRTNDTNDHRVSRVLDVKIEGLRLRDWPLRDLKRRHALELVDHLLRNQGRSPQGAINILRALSTLAEDAITDELCDVNPFRGVKVRANDPRATKTRRPVRVFTFEDLHKLAAAAGQHEPMIRVLSDCGLRLGEMLPLERADVDGDVLHVRRTAHEGEILDGTKSDHGEQNAGREVPIPPSLLKLLARTPTRIDTQLLFPTLTGKLWRERNWYRDVLYPAQTRCNINARPHEMRHSYISRLRAGGIDPADLADISGHTVETATAHYTHALRRSHDAVRSLIQ